MNKFTKISAATLLALSIGFGHSNVKIYASSNSILGTAQAFNVFVLGNFNQTKSDIEGRVAVGGDLKATSFSVGDKTKGTDSPAVVVGGNLDFSNGEAKGAIVYGGTVINTPTANEKVTTKGNPIDFAKETSYLTQQSLLLSKQKTTSEPILYYGSISLTGEDKKLNVFTINGADLTAAHTFRISAPEGSTVIVNVSGDNIVMSNMGMFLDKVSKHNVIYNFYESKQLEIKQIGVQGSVLAPKSTVQFDNGNVEGTLIAGELNGYGESHHFPFESEVPPMSPDGEDPPTEQPPTEQPPTEQPPTEQPPTEQPPTEQPPTEQPPTEQPPTEQPPTEQPPTEQPPTEQPPTEQPPTEQPPTEQPPTEQPPTEQPPTEQPPTEQPPTEQPPTEQPPTEQPPTEQPPTEQPPTEQPPTEQPPTEQPPTEQPPAEQPPTVPPTTPALPDPTPTNPTNPTVPGTVVIPDEEVPQGSPTPDPTPSTETPSVPTDEVTIPEDPTPLGTPEIPSETPTVPTDEVTIPEDPTPLGTPEVPVNPTPVPTDEVTIPEDPTPLGTPVITETPVPTGDQPATLPQTGEASQTPMYMLGLALVALGAGLFRRGARK